MTYVYSFERFENSPKGQQPGPKTKVLAIDISEWFVSFLDIFKISHDRQINRKLKDYFYK